MECFDDIGLWNLEDWFCLPLGIHYISPRNTNGWLTERNEINFHVLRQEDCVFSLVSSCCVTNVTSVNYKTLFIIYLCKRQHECNYCTVGGILAHCDTLHIFLC